MIARRIPTRALLALSATAGIVLASASYVQAAEPVQDGVVSANPANTTPNVENHKVESMVKIGNRIIAVGNFTQVTPPGGTTVTRNSIFAFNASTGALDSTFVPNVGTKEVTEVVDAGDGTVYIGGTFTSVNGTATPGHVAQLNATSGDLVTTFKAPKSNGSINDMQLVNGKLYIGGSFTTVGGQPQTLLAALNPSTGADTGQMNLTFSDTWNGGTMAVKHFDISNDGSRLVAIGNFRTVDGQSRAQIVMVDTDTTPATVDTWSTQRYTASCASVFDTYMRDVDIAPSGNYFAVVTTGAYGGPDSLCDTASRWEINGGPDSQPTWIDTTGGDTQTQVKITGAAIYTGGHMRWMNNPFAGDQAGPGAVPRTGLSALDPRNGLPFSWNPTRARHVGVWKFLPTADGLWIGHDSNQLGHETRKRIAFMPLAGGATIPPDNTGSLPGNVYTLGAKPSASAHWIARVDAGGSTVLANDNGPDWISDGNVPNTNATDWQDLPIARGANLPATTPTAIFSTERWSPNDSPAMSYDFAAPVGHDLTVRLYFSNGCSCTENAGQRQFNVNIDGNPVLTNYDIVADVGDQTGTMKQFNVVSDGQVNIDFSHVVENPLVNGIEIIDNSVPAPGAGANDTVVKRTFSGSNAGSPTNVSSGNVAWGSDRGAVMIDGKLFTGWSDGTFKVRTFSGTTFGAASDVNLYGLMAFSNDVSNMTGMFFDKATGRLYYTLAGRSRLYYRYFTPQSQVVGAVRFTATDNAGGVDWSDTSGVFLAGGKLYIGSSSDGNLRSIGWDSGSGTVTGSLSGPISGPATGDGNDYRARGMFLYAG